MATIRLNIAVDDIDAVMSQYTSIHVQRSSSAPPDVVPVDLTAAAATPAVLSGLNSGPFTVHGKTLVLSVNGVPVSSTFITSDPVAIEDVVGDLNASFLDAGVSAVASDDGTGKLRISTILGGTQDILEVIDGDSLSSLGLSIGDKDNGEAEYITLLASTELYTFLDGSGLPSSYYRTRYININDDSASAWSEWKLGQGGYVVDLDDLIVAKLRLASLEGTAFSKKRVVIYNTFDPTTSNGYGIFGSSVTMETDALGYAETVLAKGSLIDVVFPGTSIVRRIRVPSTGAEFDLLDEALIVDDAFEIQRPVLPYAPRRS